MLTSDNISNQIAYIRVVISNFINKEKTHFNFAYYIFKYTIFLLQCGGNYTYHRLGLFGCSCWTLTSRHWSAAVHAGAGGSFLFCTRSLDAYIYISVMEKKKKNNKRIIRDAICISKPPALHFFPGSCWVSHLRARGAMHRK